MKKNSKARGQGKTKTRKLRADNFKVIDLGVCMDYRCPDYVESDEGVTPHSHARIYAPGVAGLELIELMKKTYAELGFVGDLEVKVTKKKVLFPKYDFETENTK